MYIKLLLLITISIISAQHDSYSLRIKDDAATYVQLHMKYLQRLPFFHVRSIFAKSCRVVHDCCPAQRYNLFKLIHENKLPDTCIKAPGTIVFQSYTPECKSLVQSWYNFGKPGSAYNKYVDAIRSIPGASNRAQYRRSLMLNVCSADELEAYYCQPENRVPLQSCVEKVLRSIGRKEGADSYHTFVHQFKNDFKSIYNAIHKAFPYVV